MTGNFIIVTCEKCKNRQIIFEKASSIVKCLVCGEVLTTPTGGKVEIRREKNETEKLFKQSKKGG